MYLLQKYLRLVGLMINDHVCIVEVSPPGMINDHVYIVDVSPPEMINDHIYIVEDLRLE